jgi:hypothetical protein
VTRGSATTIVPRALIARSVTTGFGTTFAWPWLTSEFWPTSSKHSVRLTSGVDHGSVAPLMSSGTYTLLGPSMVIAL